MGNRWSMYNVGIRDIMALNKKIVLSIREVTIVLRTFYTNLRITSTYFESIDVPYHYIINVSKSSMVIRKCLNYIAKGAQYDRSKRIDADEMLPIFS